MRDLRSHAQGVRPALRAALSCIALMLLAACRENILQPEGPVAANERIIIWDSTAIMLAIIVPTIIAAFVMAWWFRASNTKARYLPEWAYSGRLELLVWSIPLLTILFIAGVVWISSHELDPARPLPSKAPPLEVQVVSFDWKWLFIYPQLGVASVNELVAPAGRPVHLAMTSASVMNALWIPRIAGMEAVMNGVVTNLNIQADRPGDYYGRSSQFSGDGFPDMHFTMHVVAPADFPAWVAAARGSGPVLDRAAYQALARQSRNVRPYTYRAVDPTLFQLLAERKLPSGPGPQAGRGGPAVLPQPEP